jgi:hypothetical protein
VYVRTSGGGLADIDLGEHLVEGSTGPVERVRDLVPLRDKGEDSLFQLRDIREVGSREPLPLQDGEPLFDLVHPGAVHRREVHLEARMLLEPGANLLAVMNADVVADDVDELDLGRRFLIDLLEEFDELDLSLSPTTDSEDLSVSPMLAGEAEVRSSRLDTAPARSTKVGACTACTDSGRFCETRHPEAPSG